MQDGGVVTVAMISRDACKTSITHKNCAVFIVFSFKQVGREAISKSIASSELKLNIKRVRDC